MADEVVGRAAELDAVESFLERAGTGLAALALAGEAGIGKSTVWRAAAEEARVRGWLVLSSRPAQSERGMTLGGLIDLLGGIEDGAFGGLPGPQRDALRVALLREAPASAAPDQRTLSVAVAGLLRQLAEPGRPVLIAIDDVQFLDDSSASILAYAIRRLADRPIGLLAAVRTGAETTASDEVLAAVPVDRIERVDLGPMHLAPLHRLFQVHLGRSFPRLTLVRIEAASRGNPLFALELARARIRSGAAADAHDSLPVPETLGTLIARRVALLPPSTRAAMLLAACAAEPTVETLEAASPGFVKDLGPAIEDHLVALDRDVVRFAHPLFAQSVTSLAPPAELRSAHATLASATPSADARARHLAQAADGRDESVAAALEQAAHDARLRGATLDAAALFEDAARLTPADDPSAALRRSQTAAECLFIDLLEYLESDGILADAIERSPAGPARADALSLRGILRYYHGRIAEATMLAEQAFGEAGDDPRRRGVVLGRLAYLVMQRDLERGVGLVDQAVGLLERAGGPVDPDALANVILLRAVGELALVRPTRPGRDRTRPRPDLDRRPILGEGGRRGQRLRDRPRHGRSRPGDRDDPRDDPHEVGTRR